MPEIRLELNSGPHFNLRTNGGLSEHLNLGNTVPVPIRNYELLDNKPQINGVTLIGNKTSKQLKIQETDPISDEEIEAIIQMVFF